MWLTLFSNTFHLGLLACIAHKMLMKRYAYSIQLITIIYLLFIAFVLRYASFTRFDPYVIFILSTLFLLINYKWTWKSHAVLLCFFSLDLLLSAFLVQQLCNPLFAISMTQMDRTLFLFFGLIFRCSIALILAYLGLLFYSSYKEALFTKRSGLILILPITTLFLILTIQNTYEQANHSYPILLIITGLCIANIISLYVYHNSLIDMKNRMRLEKEQALSQQQYEAMRTLMYQHNASLHEIRQLSKHMLTLLEQKEEEKAKETLYALLCETTYMHHMINSPLVHLNIILKAYMEKIKRAHIEVRIQCELNDIFMNTADTSTFLEAVISFCILHVKQSRLPHRLLYIKCIACSSNQILCSFSFSCEDAALHILSLQEELSDIIHIYDILLSLEFDAKCKCFTITALYTKKQ